MVSLQYNRSVDDDYDGINARFDLISLLSELKLDQIELWDFLLAIKNSQLNLSETIALLADWAEFREKYSTDEWKRFGEKTKALDNCVLSLLAKIQRIVIESLKKHSHFQNQLPVHLFAVHLLTEFYDKISDMKNYNLHEKNEPICDEQNSEKGPRFLRRICNFSVTDLELFIDPRVRRWSKFLQFSNEARGMIINSESDWNLIEAIYEDFFQLDEKDLDEFIDMISGNNHLNSINAVKRHKDNEIIFQFIVSLREDAEFCVWQFVDIVKAFRLINFYAPYLVDYTTSDMREISKTIGCARSDGQYRMCLSHQKLSHLLELSKTLSIFSSSQQNQIIRRIQFSVLNAKQLFDAISYGKILMKIRSILFNIKCCYSVQFSSNTTKNHAREKEEKKIKVQVDKFTSLCVENFFELILIRISTVSLVHESCPIDLNAANWERRINFSRQLERQIIWFLPNDQRQIFNTLDKIKFDYNDLNSLLMNYECVCKEVFDSSFHQKRDGYLVGICNNRNFRDRYRKI